MPRPALNEPPGAAGPCLFLYGEAEVAHLAARDAALARLMERLGPIRRERIPDPFMALVHSIAGQQISGAAHATVWGRLVAAYPAFTPEALAAASQEDLRACGLSKRKGAAVLEIARRAASGELDLATLPALDDAALCERLCALPGVGRWTAEMIMIFSLGRMNVLSLGDFGIRKGLRMLYRKRELGPAFVARLQKRYAPYASVASLYLWALAGGSAGDDYTDPAQKAAPKAVRKPAQKPARKSVQPGVTKDAGGPGPRTR